MQTFSYEFTPINDLQVTTRTDSKTGRVKVDKVVMADDPYDPSDRFWTSLFARFGFNKAFFRYFEYPEVFNRIAEREAGDQMRVCVEHTTDETGTQRNRLLAVSNPVKPIVAYDELMEMLGTYHGDNITYNDGIVESMHIPRIGSGNVEMNGDIFNHRFALSTPIDGYGLPNVYLALLRQICENGAIAISKAFRSQVSLGKADDNVAFALTRMLDQFSNDEGYAALRDRITAAGTSWASVYESSTLYKLLIKLHSERGLVGTDGEAMQTPYMRNLLSHNTDGEVVNPDDETIGSPVIRAFHNMTGDTTRLYGLANLDALSSKRQRTLPVRCKVYDLINFVTEVASHHAAPAASRKLQAYFGSLVSGEYDMEGTCEKFSDFADFHVDAKVEAGLTGSDPRDSLHLGE